MKAQVIFNGDRILTPPPFTSRRFWHPGTCLSTCSNYCPSEHYQERGPNALLPTCKGNWHALRPIFCTRRLRTWQDPSFLQQQLPFLDQRPTISIIQKLPTVNNLPGRIVFTDHLNTNWRWYTAVYTVHFNILTLHPQSEKENPEVIDDWPLHPAADIKTSLSVGACWHGKKWKFTSKYCTEMHYTVLYCTALHWPDLHCTALHYTAVHQEQSPRCGTGWWVTWRACPYCRAGGSTARFSGVWYSAQSHSRWAAVGWM